MAQETQTATDELLDKVDAPGDEEEAREFVDEVLQKVIYHLNENRKTARNMTGDVERNVADVLKADNVRDIQVRAKRYENPRVTVWLRDCPMWANDAGNDTCYPKGMNAYNGKVNFVWDVRPF